MNKNKNFYSRLELLEKYRYSLEVLIDKIIPGSKYYNMPKASAVIDCVDFLAPIEIGDTFDTFLLDNEDKSTDKTLLEFAPDFVNLIEPKLVYAYYLHSDVQKAIQNHIDDNCCLKTQERDTRLTFFTEATRKSPIYRKV